jgi:hypothetical protein
LSSIKFDYLVEGINLYEITLFAHSIVKVLDHGFGPCQIFYFRTQGFGSLLGHIQAVGALLYVRYAFLCVVE